MVRLLFKERYEVMVRVPTNQIGFEAFKIHEPWRLGKPLSNNIFKELYIKTLGR